MFPFLFHFQRTREDSSTVSCREK